MSLLPYFPSEFVLQVQFTKFHCTSNSKNDIEYEFKKGRLPAKQKKDLLSKKRKYDDPEEKRGSQKEI